MKMTTTQIGGIMDTHLLQVNEAAVVMHVSRNSGDKLIAENRTDH